MIRTESNLMFSTRGEDIVGKRLSWVDRIRGRKVEPAEWTVPYEAFTSSTWADVPDLDRLVQANWRIVYRTDDTQNGVRLYGFNQYWEHMTGPEFRHGDLKWAGGRESPINHSMNVTEFVKGSGQHNFGYKVWVGPGSVLRLYKVSLELRWS